MSKLQKHEREAVGIIEAIFDQAQLEHRRERGGKHLSVFVIHNGTEHKIPIPGSPRGDVKSLMNMARQQATRLVKSLGIDPTGKPLDRAS